MDAKRRARNNRPPARQQRGAVAVMVGLALAVLLGFFGLAVDGGRLYINKAELQTAADACALAASQELVCNTAAGTCPASFLQNAEAAGILAASRNKANLQANAVAIPAADVRFSTTLGPTSSYLSRAGGASTNSRFAMCIARTNGIVPLLMGVLGAGASNVTGSSVATLAPGQSFCSGAPMGICRAGGGTAPNFGYTVGAWIQANFTGSGNGNADPAGLAGSFRWVDFTANAGGNNEIREQLYGRSQACGLKVGDNVNQQGAQQGAKLAYNTRFGLYQPGGGGAETPATAPPDRTGFAYPTKAPFPNPQITVATGNAYANYRAKQATHTPFTQNQYANGNPSGNVTANANYVTYGAERRLVPVPVIDCAAGNSVPILGMACVLMVNPMPQGNTGPLYLEFVGSALLPGSPCRTFGLSGGPTGNGPLVPTLVQ